jgi:competence protein ComEC
MSPFLPPSNVVIALSLSAPILCVMQKKYLVGAGWLLVGYCWSVVYCQATIKQWLPEGQEGHEIEISGHLMDFPQPRDRGWQFDFYSDELKGKIRLGIYEPYSSSSGRVPQQSSTTQALRPPQLDCHYRMHVQLKRPRGLVNFGLYDYQAWLLQSGYLATGSIKSIVGCESYSPSSLLLWRESIANKIKSVKLSERASSTLLALLIGSYANIDLAQWQVLRDSGTIHLLSVSGLHIVLIAMLAHICVFHSCRLLVFPTRFYPADLYGGFASIVFAVFYAYLAGFSVATQRSLIMVLVAVTQRFLYGRFRFGTALAVALLVVLLSNPLSILSSGFWFSFWATAVLMYSSRGTLDSGERSWKIWLLDFIRPQWLVFVLLAPMLLYVYGRMPILSLPLNFFAVPWVSFISLPLAFAALAAFSLSNFLAELLLMMSGWTLDFYWKAMEWGIALGRNIQIDLGGISLISLILALTGFVLLFLIRQQARFATFLSRGLGVVLCLPMLLKGPNALQKSEVEMTVLDVGQGLSVIIRTAKHVLVYDTGDKRSERFDAGRDIVAPALRNLRLDHMSMLVLSHSDSDHAGGAAGLLQEFTSRQHWSGTPESLHLHDTFLPCRTGMHWRWDGVDFMVLHPALEQDQSTNNRGCVIKISTPDSSILLAADIENIAEQQILASKANIHADILVSPHHGSKTSSSDLFLEAVNASTAIISSGYLNRYHHPSPEVINRYQQRGMKIINTAETGAVRLRLENSGMETSLAICERHYFWRDSFWHDKRYCQTDYFQPH